MKKESRPVLSVIVRRFRQDALDDVKTLVRNIQTAMAEQPGFAGLQSSLKTGDEICELVTVFSFDSQENLEKWERSRVRKSFVRSLDAQSQGAPTQMRVDGLERLLPAKANISKIETVAILIFWILALGEPLRLLAGALLPAGFGGFWRNAAMVAASVLLISYGFLPWTCVTLTRLKARLGKRFRKP